MENDSSRKGQLQPPAGSYSPGAGSEFLRLHNLEWWLEISAICAFVGLLIILRWDAVLNISTHYVGGSERDAGFYMWLAKSNLRDLVSYPWFNTAAFYPYTRTLAWSDNFILPSFLMGLLPLGASRPALAWNIVLLGAGFLNGYLTFRLCYKLSGDFGASFAGGALFMGLSWFSGNLGHPQLQFVFWLPAALRSVSCCIHCLCACLGHCRRGAGQTGGLEAAILDSACIGCCSRLVAGGPIRCAIP